MQSKIIQTARIGIASVFFLILSGFISKHGGDSYEIYLGNKILVKQFVTQPIALKSITLSGENLNDHLTLFYNHCGQVGNDRTISLQDQKGNKIKQWKFVDAGSSNPTSSGAGMIIPVKDIISMLDKAGSPVGLYYSAKQLPNGRFLTSLNSLTRATVAR